MSNNYEMDDDGFDDGFDDDQDIEELLRIANDNEATEDSDIDTGYLITGTPEQSDNYGSGDNDFFANASTNTNGNENFGDFDTNTFPSPDFNNDESNEKSSDFSHLDVPSFDDTTDDEPVAQAGNTGDFLSGNTSNERNSRVADYQPQYTEENFRQEQERQKNATVEIEDSKPVVESPAPQPMVQPEVQTHTGASRKVSIRKEIDQIDEARRVIATLDFYRTISSDSRTIVSQFIYGENDVDPDDEAALVVKALRADPMLEKVMMALQEAATERDRVQRVYYILELPSDVLYALGDLVNTFSEDEINTKLDKIPLSRVVEANIESLDDKIIGYVSDTRAVLEVARNGGIG